MFLPPTICCRAPLIDGMGNEPKTSTSKSYYLVPQSNVVMAREYHNAIFLYRRRGSSCPLLYGPGWVV